MNKLPNDICRCHDSECAQKEKCLRWLERESFGKGTLHTIAMRLEPQKECEYFISNE